jgi:ketosteroid isomerase-like protein
MPTETRDAIEAFRSYVRAFGALDPARIAAHFSEPALMIAHGEVSALPTRAAVEQTYKRVLAYLPARGYDRTELSSLAELPLSADVSLVTGAGVWKTAAGEDLMRFGMTYTLRRERDGWRIVVAIIHDAEAP